MNSVDDSSFTGERIGLLARFESADDERLVVVGFVLLCFIFVRERFWTLFSLSWVRLVHGQLTFCCCCFSSQGRDEGSDPC